MSRASADGSAHPRARLVALTLVMLAAVVPLTTATALAARPASTGPGFLTVQFGRSIWTAANNCAVVPGVLTLQQIAQDLQARSMTGTGTVVINRTKDTGEMCLGADFYSSWADLTTLNSTYGWQFMSDGLTHGDMTKMTPSQQNQESCGSLPALTSHGFTSAQGLFAYGDDHFTTAIQSTVVSTCFAFGRTYRGGVNVRARTVAPWFQNTNSITGGACNVAGQPCYSTTLSGKHYMSPDQLGALVGGEGRDQWIDLQFYRLVTGSSTSGPEWSWDCTNPDWRLHWTAQPEFYCQNDFDSIMSRVPSGVVVTDPATVATAWGRHPGT